MSTKSIRVGRNKVLLWYALVVIAAHASPAAASPVSPVRRVWLPYAAAPAISSNRPVLVWLLGQIRQERRKKKQMNKCFVE